jgi:hypothetical protein
MVLAWMFKTKASSKIKHKSRKVQGHNAVVIQVGTCDAVGKRHEAIHQGHLIILPC